MPVCVLVSMTTQMQMPIQMITQMQISIQMPIQMTTQMQMSIQMTTQMQISIQMSIQMITQMQKIIQIPNQIEQKELPREEVANLVGFPETSNAAQTNFVHDNLSLPSQPNQTLLSLN